MDDHKNANAPAARVSKAWLWRAIKFESVPILVLVFALLYSNGYAYLETVKLELGMPINRLGYDTYQFVVYGGIDILVKLAAIFLAIAGGAIFAVMMHFTENPDRVFPIKPEAPDTFRYKLGQRLKKSYTKARMQIIGVLLIVLLAFSIWLIWKIAFSQSIERGKLNAYEEIRNCKPSTVRLKNLDVVTACIVGESDDMLYLIDKNTQGSEIQFQERRIPKNSISSTAGPVSLLKKPD